MAALRQFVTQPEWNIYLQSLIPCQRAYPNVYYPIELFRIDLVNTEEFVSLARSSVAKWKEVSALTSSKENLDKQKALSCEINRALKNFMDQEQKNKKSTLIGATIEVLPHIPEKMRLALTPLDSLFLKTHEAGKKIFADLQKRPEINLEAVVIDQSNKRLVFQGKPSAWANLPVAPKKYYSLDAIRERNGEWSLRARGKNKIDRIGSDKKIREEFLGGGFFNQKNMERLPLGAYPREEQIWKDETGLSHFRGDGHKH